MAIYGTEGRISIKPRFLALFLQQITEMLHSPAGHFTACLSQPLLQIHFTGFPLAVRPPMNPALRGFDAVHNFTSSFSEIHFYIILPFLLRYPTRAFLSCFKPKFCITAYDRASSAVLPVPEGEPKQLAKISLYSYFAAFCCILYVVFCGILKGFRKSLYIIQLTISHLYHNELKISCAFSRSFHGSQTCLILSKLYVYNEFTAVLNYLRESSSFSSIPVAPTWSRGHP
jgi:hypothetical protein